jgi:hypothetical protein
LYSPESAIRGQFRSLRQPLGAFEGGLKGDSPGDFWVLGSYAPKASSYHFDDGNVCGAGGAPCTRT